MAIKPEHLDELLSGYEKPEDLLGEEGLFKQLKKALLERALGAELTHHLGYEKGDPAGRGSGNNRNGTYSKTVLTEDGAVGECPIRCVRPIHGGWSSTERIGWQSIREEDGELSVCRAPFNSGFPMDAEIPQRQVEELHGRFV